MPIGVTSSLEGIGRLARGMAFALGLSLAPTGLGATIHASLDSDTVYYGESAQLTISIENGTPREIPLVPEVPNLVFTGPAQGHQTTWVNGRQSSSFNLQWGVQPTQPGEYTIPSIRVQIGDQTLATQPLRLKAMETMNPAINQAVSLRLETPTNRVYVGEALPVEIALYVRPGSVRGLREAPQLTQEGLTVGGMESLDITRRRSGGQLYDVVPFRSYVIGARAGILALGPATMTVPLQFRSPLDIFAQTRNVKLRSSVIELEVLPLPTEGIPPGFTGAVGRYDMNVRVSSDTVTAGDPITVTVRIKGRGPIESLQLGSFQDWEGFKTYAPETEVELSDKLGLEGAKTFNQVVVPERSEIVELPSIKFSYFDPQVGRYQTRSQPAIPITVTRGNAIVAAPTLSEGEVVQAEEPLPAKDMVHIKTRLGVYGTVQPPLVMRPWFLGLQLVPLGAWWAALFWRWRREKLNRNPRLRRRQQVARLTREGLAELRRAAAGNDGDAFFVTVFRLLQERLGERLDLPATAITEAVLDERLESELDDGLLQELHQLFQACNAARYAPSRSDQGLETFIPKVESALNRLGSGEAV